MEKIQLFLELASPDKDGRTKWINCRNWMPNNCHFVGKYRDLKFGNGADWARQDGSLGRKYVVEFDKTKSPGNSIDRIRLNGFNVNNSGNQNIKKLL